MARQNPLDDSCVGVIVRALAGVTLIALTLVFFGTLILA